MTITEEHLQQITQFSEGMMTPKEICHVLELDFRSLAMDFEDPNSDIGKAYLKGYLQLKYRLNIKNIKFAEQSSSHAMNKVLKTLEESQIQRRKDIEQQDQDR